MTRRFLDTVMRGVLFVAALSSSIVILLIIGFLFKEGAGIVGAVPLEFDTIMVAHPSTGVASLAAEEIREVSERKVTDGTEVGGAPVPITFLDYDDSTWPRR